MERVDLEDMRLRRKQQVMRLMEVSDLTNQLLDATDRRDQVSVQMLVSMRQDPIQQLQELEEGVRQRILELPEEDAIRMNELLQGAEPADAAERDLTEQVSQYRRALESTVELDRRLSLKLGGRHSFYNKFRKT